MLHNTQHHVTLKKMTVCKALPTASSSKSRCSERWNPNSLHLNTTSFSKQLLVCTPMAHSYINRSRLFSLMTTDYLKARHGCQSSKELIQISDQLTKAYPGTFPGQWKRTAVKDKGSRDTEPARGFIFQCPQDHRTWNEELGMCSPYLHSPLTHHLTSLVS